MAETAASPSAPQQQTWKGHAFPEIFSAGRGGVLPEFIETERARIDTALAATGAVLFRGFDVPESTAFDQAVLAYGAENFPYAESLSNAVRVNVTPRVFTANEAPPTTSIYLHHEMAQTPVYPSKLFFYCEQAPGQGGATPLCRSDILLDDLWTQAPDLMARFERLGVRYSNTMPAENDAQSGQGRSWKSTLGAETKAAAEARLSALGYDWTWQSGDTLRVTSPVLSAVRTLPDGRRVFFNQLIAAYRGWADGRNDPSKAITFGDGTPLQAEDMATAIDLSDRLSWDLEWQTGDVALIDNFLVMHGRRPFEGKRRVLASLIK